MVINKLNNDLKIAIKNRNKIKIQALRNIIGNLNLKKIDKGSDLTKDEINQTLSKQYKRIKESIKQFKRGDRFDLVEKEEDELNIIEGYLPEPQNMQEINEIINKVINDLNASTMKDFGTVMGKSIQKLSHTIDGKLIQKIVKSKLTK